MLSIPLFPGVTGCLGGFERFNFLFSANTKNKTKSLCQDETLHCPRVSSIAMHRVEIAVSKSQEAIKAL